jgi:hypothetical protein
MISCLFWRGVLDTTLCDKICQRLATGTPVSSTNKTDRHDIAEILLKVALNSINQTNPVYFLLIAFFPSNFGKIIDLPILGHEHLK